MRRYGRGKKKKGHKLKAREREGGHSDRVMVADTGVQAAVKGSR